jgi:hypothetical protein
MVDVAATPASNAAEYVAVAVGPVQSLAAPARPSGHRRTEDMLSRAPYPLRPLLQATHYQLSRLSEAGMDGDIMLRSMRSMPSSEHYNRALFGNEAQRLESLSRLGRFIASGSVEAIVADWTAAVPDNAVSLRALRKLCDRLLGDQPDVHQALRQANRALLQVHADKIERLRPRFNDRMQAYVCEDITLLLQNLRKLLQDPVVGPAIYRPSRPAYGQVSLKGTVLPALLVGAGAASFFFARMGGRLLGDLAGAVAPLHDGRSGHGL